MHDCLNTKLITYASHHIRWLDDFPVRLSPTVKLQAAVALACNSFNLSNDVKESGDHLLFMHWNASPQQREMILAETTKIEFIGIAANKRTVVINRPSLI